MRITHSLSCLSVVILLSSCASTTTNYYPQTLSSWQGSNMSALIQRWGNPNSKVINRDGNTIYIYKTESYHYYNEMNAANAFNVSKSGRPIFVSQPRTNVWTRGSIAFPCYASFETNSQGQILHTSSQGTGCYGSDNFAHQYGNSLSARPKF